MEGFFYVQVFNEILWDKTDNEVVLIYAEIKWNNNNNNNLKL